MAAEHMEGRGKFSLRTVENREEVSVKVLLTVDQQLSVLSHVFVKW